MEEESAVRGQPSGMEVIVTDPIPRVSVSELADRLFRKRKGRILTLGQASEQIGVSVATLSRLERQRHESHAVGEGTGKFVPDTRTLAAVAHWLDVPLGQIVGGDVPEPIGTRAPILVPAVTHREGESVPDMVEAHLRADRRLDGEAALALAQMFRVAYDQFSRLHQAQAPMEQPDEKER